MEAISNLLYLLSPPVNHKVYIPRGLLLCPGENSSEPLSATDLSCGHRDGSNVRVAYQGIPGAYSEAAALKAYPKCEPVPCDQFEAAFKAVELWLVDKAVLQSKTQLLGVLTVVD